MRKENRMIELLLFAVLSITTMVGIDNVKDHSLDVMEDVGESVYSVFNETGRGTAWATTSKSGKVVLVTNVHVCDGPSPFMVTEQKGRKLILPILAKDPTHDICLLKAPRGAVPLDLADDVYENETAYSVGFPLVEFLSSQRGLVKGYQQIQMEYPLPLELCKGQKKLSIKSFKYENDEGEIIEKKICVFSAEALVTTIVVDGGASGSPIVNEDEEVIGMTMLRAGNVNWAQGVPLKNLKAFLNKY
jgi:Trypsin-like peptidase domain